MSAHGGADGGPLLRVHSPEYPGTVRGPAGFLRRHLRESQAIPRTGSASDAAGAGTARLSESRGGVIQPAVVLSVWQRVVHRGVAAAFSDPSARDQPRRFAAPAGALLAGIASGA